MCCRQAEVRTLERVSERIKGSIRDIDSRVTRISQTATRIGDRLQVCGRCKGLGVTGQLERQLC